MDISDPRELGFDPERLARIPAFLEERYLKPGLLAGTQVMVAREGKPVLFATQGAARTDGEPLRDDGLFRIASMTKPVTSVAFMMLFEQGKVTLDQPVHTILPEFRDIQVYDGGGAGTPFRTKPAERPMQMIDLLRHTSGLT